MQLIYGLQWVIYNIGIILTIPIIGQALQLDPLETASLIQRLFVLLGIASLLQVLRGHRLLLIEGPAAPWLGAIIVLASVTVQTGGNVSDLRTDLQGAMLAVGIVLVVLGSMGIMTRILSLFTPAIMGTVLLLIALQIGSIGVTGIFNSIDLTSQGPHLLFIPCLVIAIIVRLSLRGKGLFKTVAIILGIAAGWLLYVVGGFVTPMVQPSHDLPIVSFPEVFPWGAPTFNLEVIIPMVLLGLVLIPNVAISINAMQATIQTELSKKSYDKGLIFSGVSDFLAGLFGSIGTAPYAISAGLVALTGIKSRLPFIIGCIMYIVLGIFPAVGGFIVQIPQSIAHAVLIVAASPLVIYALKDFQRCSLDNREVFVIGLSLLIGIGLMFTPVEALYGLPVWAINILGNGVITGALVCILLEHLVLRKQV